MVRVQNRPRNLTARLWGVDGPHETLTCSILGRCQAALKHWNWSKADIIGQSWMIRAGSLKRKVPRQHELCIAHKKAGLHRTQDPVEVEDGTLTPSRSRPLLGELSRAFHLMRDYHRNIVILKTDSSHCTTWLAFFQIVRPRFDLQSG